MTSLGVGLERDSLMHISKQKPDGMVRLFDRGVCAPSNMTSTRLTRQQDFFSAHGADALLVAHQVYKTTSSNTSAMDPPRPSPRHLCPLAACLQSPSP